MSRHFLVAVALGCIVLMLTLAGAARATTILIDDFDDGNDDGWTRRDALPEPPAGPGVWELVELGPMSYEYNLRNGGVAPITSANYMYSRWDNSAAPLYSNGFLRAKVRADTEQTLPWLAMRSPVEGETYIFAADPVTRQFSIQGGVPYFVEYLEDPAITFDVGENWHMEGGTVGDQISLKVWEVGTPEPAAPQMTITNSDISSGIFGVGANVPTDYMPGFIDATFDDIYFTPIPEPSASLLLLLGTAGVLSAARRLGGRESRMLN